MASAGEWCLIESDPGVFTELIKDFGVEGLQVEELFSLDSESFKSLKPVYGLIFLFKCVKDDSSEGTLVQDSRLENMFFAKQVISNACATQAIISILLNTQDEEINLGDNLREFKNFTKSFDPAMKGLALSNSKLIRQVHNSFSRQQIFEYDEKATKSEDAYHFIGYMPYDGRLYELDGLKPSPIDHGPVSKDDWIDTVRPVIQKRMNRYAAGEIHFNLMAIVADVKMTLEKQMNSLRTKLKSSLVEDTEEERKVKEEAINQKLEECQRQIHQEIVKRQQHRVENIRRKHNYLPFIIEMLRIVAANGKLVPLVESAKQKQTEKQKSS